MIDEKKEIGSQHTGVRSALRILGPCLIFVGLIFMITGMVSFFSAFAGSGSPKYFWCCFVGMPLLAAGGALTKFGYMGAVGRYMVNEVAPVGKDAINYMADGTKDSIGQMAAAIGKGFREGSGSAQAGGVVLRCHKCNEDNEASAKFCNECGTPLAKSKQCTKCGELNDPDAKFCDNCGRKT
jgi:hypothetical protein